MKKWMRKKEDRNVKLMDRKKMQLNDAVRQKWDREDIGEGRGGN